MLKAVYLLWSFVIARRRNSGQAMEGGGDHGMTADIRFNGVFVWLGLRYSADDCTRISIVVSLISHIVYETSHVRNTPDSIIHALFLVIMLVQLPAAKIIDSSAMVS